MARGLPLIIVPWVADITGLPDPEGRPGCGVSSAWSARRWEPKRLCLRVFTVVGRLVRGAVEPRRDSRSAGHDPAPGITCQPMPQASTRESRNIEA
jgi:hypothetical protein